MGFSLFDPTSWFDGGGGGSSAQVTSNVNLKLEGLDKMSLTDTVTLNGNHTENLNLGGTHTENLNLGGSVTVNDNVNGTFTLNDNVNGAFTLNDNVNGTVTSNNNIDLKPVAIDACQTLRLAPLPETRVCQPYRHHVGYTLFGVELMGVVYEGESEQSIGSPRRPQVVERLGRVEPRRPRPRAEIAGAQGIRVRVLDPDE